MAWFTARQRLAGLLIVAAMLGAGCNLLTPLILLLPETKVPPALARLTASKKGPIKVVILASPPPETQLALARVDRDVSKSLARRLLQSFKENKENVTLVPPRLVESFKDEHPDWQSLDAAEIGKEFEADYVIVLAMKSFSLFEKGTTLLCRGKTEIKVTLVDVNKPDEEDPVSKTYACEFPRSGPLQADEGNLTAFRQRFLDHVAKHLSWYFTEHPLDADNQLE